MPLSRSAACGGSAKISLLLAVDVLFFYVEIIAGYAVGSLALVVDSFHMLNDVMSLIVAYTLLRAEVVAALVNGVFLLALCFSIFMEAMERFFSTPKISNPKLVVIVGSLGLASNFLGLLLFHEHTHSHSHDDHKPAISRKQKKKTTGTAIEPVSLASDLYGYPAATRASAMQAAQDIGYGRSTSPARYKRGSSHERSSSFVAGSEDNRKYRETQSLLGRRQYEDFRSRHIEDKELSISTQPPHNYCAITTSTDVEAALDDEPINEPELAANAGHVLHVIGDVLGNVGVIATGLIIWFSTWQYKYYFDPVISLIITCIIFSFTLPLVRSAAFILLQAVPSTISLQDLREDNQEVPGVLSVHELHVWQLSEITIVATVHVWVSRNREYMGIAQDIRRMLHDHGVHSSTIQPEFHDPTNAPSEEHLIVSYMMQTSGRTIALLTQSCNCSISYWYNVDNHRNYT
ncbi:hypothetical protein M422DRAFT_265107 [Sphaerobolus stellatus SS14]|uniref:Cation efflux protein n=1 Tax=Sphaerobolus stellatus (strain SS14) TaxID=990650 RepID=A0A0C9TS51_SPHS4|nr:hypothetical protein M422DRAFT_265107 [Sphaerobolus stellatus SS14]